MKTLFIAGTDTAVGKTAISCALAGALKMRGYKVAVMKPISCGGIEDALLLKKYAGSEADIKYINPIALKHPLSPNVAARLENKKINIRPIMTSYQHLAKDVDYLVVEGCGGLLVPIDSSLKVIDLIPMFKAETILVARSGLGTINHTLLSLEALRNRRIEPLGVVFNRVLGGNLNDAEKTNPQVIERIGKVPVLGMYPYLKNCANERCAIKAFLKHIDLKKIIC